MIKRIINSITAPFIKYKIYVIITIVIFMISLLYGSIKVGDISPEEASSISRELLYPIFMDNSINDFISRFFGPSVFWLILLRNISVTALVLYGSLITIGAVGLLVIISNGYMIGLALNVLTAASELPMYKIVLGGILPHGIFELPAFFLACSLGLYAGSELIRAVFKKGRYSFVFLLKKFSAILIRVIIPLLIIAAFIETYITPIIFEHILNF